MCGIFGYFNSTRPASPEIRRWADSARRALLHRGPDGSDVQEFLGGRCLLGHTRLSIIDIAGGMQPLSNEDGSVWVTFNGEIYNYVELRDQLKARHQFKTNSDTEVLVHLYEEKDERMLDDLVGMFAFAILDLRKRSVFLARDRFGEKPLYVSQLHDGGWAFASELKALRSLPGLDQSYDWAGISQYIALGYVPAPRTHLAAIRKLRAAEAMTLSSAGEQKSWRYWNLEFSGTDTRPVATVADEFHEHLLESVRLRLRSDVPLGALLSGGIDSTLVVMAMRQQLPNQELRTFCAGFDDPHLDERPYAREVAGIARSLHRESTIDGVSLAADLDTVVRHYDEPYADYSCLPTYAVCKRAREEVTVVLTGDGADECFGGYGHHYQYSHWHWLRRAPGVNTLASPLSRIWPKGKSGSGLLAFLSQNDNSLLNSYPALSLVRNVFRPELRGQFEQGISELAHVFQAHEARRYPLSLMEVQATELTLPDQLMVKVDRASMKCGLETRAPFLDHRLAKFAANIAPDTNFKDGLGKMVLRQALPPEIPDRLRWRKKRGFTPPLATWFRTILREQLQLSLDVVPEPLRSVTRPEAMTPYFKAHMSGADDHQDVLFRWMVLVREFEAEAPSGAALPNSMPTTVR